MEAHELQAMIFDADARWPSKYPGKLALLGAMISVTWHQTYGTSFKLQFVEQVTPPTPKSKLSSTPWKIGKLLVSEEPSKSG